MNQPFRAGHTGRHSRAYEADTVSGPSVYLADCSEFQPDLNDAVYLQWSKAIVIRALYGASHDDGAWYGGARRAALHENGAAFVGIYQYLTAGQDAAAQAQAFVKLVGRLQPGELPVCDLEVGGGNQAARWRTWATVIEDAYGISPWLYSGSYFAGQAGLSPQWVAAYQSTPPSLPHLMWQFSETYKVPGVGTADCSVFGGTLSQLVSHAYGGQQKPAVQVKTWLTKGQKSLHDLCAGWGTECSTTLRLTAENSSSKVFPAPMADYLNAALGMDMAKVPKGVRLLLGSQWFTSTGHQTLQGIALERKIAPATIVRMTVEAGPNGQFAGNFAEYLNSVFSRSQTHVPAGVRLYYSA